MKKQNAFWGISAMMLIFGLLLASCATFEVVNGQPQNMGIVTASVLEGKPIIANYWQLGPLVGGLNGIINIGYDKFAAETRGKTYDVQVKQYWFGALAKVSAVSRD
jgi:hypothetical protein